tara:strand:- start:10610 stop:10924 length:315 start_codon:yes stop_codon:yes gene_type:complete
MIIKNYEITSGVAPTQIEGRLIDGREFYIRYRNCLFFVEVEGEEVVRKTLWSREGDYHREVFIETEEAFELAGMKTAIKCRRPMVHRPEFEAKVHCKTCEGEEE